MLCQTFVCPDIIRKLESIERFDFHTHKNRDIEPGHNLKLILEPVIIQVLLKYD
jgi:hypothetical protein